MARFSFKRRLDKGRANVEYNISEQAKIRKRELEVERKERELRNEMLRRKEEDAAAKRLRAEYSRTKEQRLDIKRQRETEANKRIMAYEKGKLGDERYAKSAGGRVARGFAFIRNPARVLYQKTRQERPRLYRDPYAKPRGRARVYSGSGVRQTAPGIMSGRVGRPYGTYQYRHPVTGQPIGVYEYRKILAAQLREQRIQAQAQAGYSPQQLQTLQRIQAQQQYNQTNVESRAIPDTYGQVNMKSIHDEADSYAHLVD